MITHYYKHPKTGEIFSVEHKSIKNIDKSYKLKDGTICERIPWYLVEDARKDSNQGIIDKNAEVWQKDPSYVKKISPKYVRRRDGVKEKYDPTRHR